MKAEAVQAFFTAEGNEGRIVKFAVSHDGDVVEISDEKKLADLTLFTQVKNFKEAERKYPIYAYYESKSDVAANKPSQYGANLRIWPHGQTVFGVIALDSEGKTINNLVYYAHGETPGLGGEIEKKSSVSLSLVRKYTMLMAMLL